MIVPLRTKLSVLIIILVLMLTTLTMAAWIVAHGEYAIDHLWDDTGQLFVQLALVNALFWTLASTVMAGFYVRRITDPLERIVDAAARVESGDLSVEVPLPHGDEMERFTVRFNHLVAALRVQGEENRRLVDELERANASLRDDVRRSERLAALGTLSAGLAHELNNLLSGVQGYAAVMASEIEPEHRLVPDLEMVRKSCRQASALIERFLMFARPSALKPGHHPLDALIESCLAVLKLPIEKQQIECSVQLDPELPVLWCDAVLLEQAIFNVLLNAIQAMKHGGRLSVSACVLDPETIQIAVADTGCGIAEEHLRKVWDPFFTTKGPGEGTGLGLTIAHRILEQHRGRIDIESRPGEGTRIVLILPVNGHEEAGR